jgi:phospholipase C
VVISPWTVGGYVSHSTFDHTSVIQLIETVTGVRCPNISAWRRSTVGNLGSVLGPTAFASPRLPNTQGELVAAEKQFTEFPLPAIPGAKQSFPHQPHGTKPVAKTVRSGRSGVSI